jgi:DNA-binding LytR/AlgR family response regulator
MLPSGSIVLVARNLGEALQIVCARGGELELAIIDFDDGCQGMTLLRAIATCQEELPIVVVTSRDVYHALAYANGAAACLAKPITAEEIAIVVEALKAPKRELILATSRQLLSEQPPAFVESHHERSS